MTKRRVVNLVAALLVLGFGGWVALVWLMRRTYARGMATSIVQAGGDPSTDLRYQRAVAACSRLAEDVAVPTMVLVVVLVPVLLWNGIREDGLGNQQTR